MRRIFFISSISFRIIIPTARARVDRSIFPMKIREENRGTPDNNCQAKRVYSIVRVSPRWFGGIEISVLSIKSGTERGKPAAGAAVPQKRAASLAVAAPFRYGGTGKRAPGLYYFHYFLSSLALRASPPPDLPTFPLARPFFNSPWTEQSAGRAFRPGVLSFPPSSSATRSS